MLTRKPLRGILRHIGLSGPQALTQSNKHFLKHAQLSLFDKPGIFYFFSSLKTKRILEMLTLKILIGIMITCQKNI